MVLSQKQLAINTLNTKQLAVAVSEAEQAFVLWWYKRADKQAQAKFVQSRRRYAWSRILQTLENLHATFIVCHCQEHYRQGRAGTYRLAL